MIVCDPLDLASPTINLQFNVRETCTPTITNQAAVSANEEKVPVLSNQVPTAVVRTADLMISKTGPTSVQRGNPISYLLTVKNLGPDIACEVAVHDSIPTVLTSPVLPSNPVCSISTPANEILCSIGNLSAGASSTFTLSFTAPAVCIPIVNKATVSAVPPTADPQPVNNDSANNDSGPVTTTIVDNVSITKTASRTTASPGGVLTYTIVASNSGGSPATVTDVFPAGLTQALWCRDVDPTPCIPYHAGDLQDVLAAGVATYRVQATVSPMFLGTLTNTASVVGLPGCPNNSATAMTEITLAPGVTVLCKGIDGTQVEGGTVIYTFLLLNGGPADQANAMFTDLLPAGLTLISATASSPGVTMTNPVTWNGPLPVGGMVTITITAMIGAGTRGMTFCNAPTIAFDRDGDGTNESSGAIAVPCCFTVPAIIPALSEPALATLVLLLALLALRRLRRRAL